MEIIAYEMKYEKDPIEKSDIKCIPFSQKYFQEYMKIYNACFYEMRKSLVACYGNEIDDLIVNRKFQHKGYGKQLLLWGMNYIRQCSNEPISLHVAKWNEKAVMLYEKVGFVITNTERVR